MTTLPSVRPTLRDLARERNGSEDPERDAFHFDNARDALEVARALGATPSIPEALLDRQADLSASRKGSLVWGCEKREGDVFPGAHAKGKRWLLALCVPVDQRPDDERIAKIDPIARVLAEEGPSVWQVAARFILDHSGAWIRCTTGDVRNHLLAKGYTKAEVEILLGMMLKCPWRRVFVPFGPEHPGDRQWNLGAPQLRFEPKAGPHPYWDSIFTHSFGGLTNALRDDEWAKRCGIATGADYGRAWTANLFRYPFAPLPYLFFYGEQNSGKSIFHESLALLMTKGVAAADRAFTNANDFNGELASAVLAYIEEKNVATSGAYNKLKDWVTSPTLTIRRMHTDAYQQPNTLHFVQCANELSACPADFGDTRIVMIHVPPLEHEVPKPILMERLKDEAPAFLHTLLNLPLPEPEGRLRLPAIRTDAKDAAALASVPEVAVALADAMESRTDWEGVAAELPALLGEGDWPSDARVLKRELNEAQAFLRLRGVAVSWGRRTKRGLPLAVSRAA